MSGSERQNGVKLLNFSHDIYSFLPTKRRKEETSKANMFKLYSGSMKHTR